MGKYGETSRPWNWRASRLWSCVIREHRAL
jgi:hypothetical protein